MKRPKLKRDWVGLIVVLDRQIENGRGEIFDKGRRMKVTRSFGGLHLEDIEVCATCKARYRRTVNRVSESSVTIVGRE